MKIVKEYSHTKIAEFIGKSEGTIRNMMKKSPQAYMEIIEKYKKYLIEVNIMNQKKTIAVISFKGGVGKSSIANIISNRIKNSTILNIDFGQIASSVNSATTIDFGASSEGEQALSEDHSVSEILELLLEDDECDVVIIDTPGDISEEFLDIIEKVDHFILPFKPGPRSSNGTLETYKAIFGEGYISGHHKLSVVVNEYVSDEERDQEIRAMKEAFALITLPDDLKVDISYTSLKVTMVMRTMEKTASSIDTLSAKNKMAYKAAKKRFDALSDDIIEHLELKRA